MVKLYRLIIIVLEVFIFVRAVLVKVYLKM